MSPALHNLHFRDIYIALTRSCLNKMNFKQNMFFCQLLAALVLLVFLSKNFVSSHTTNNDDTSPNGKATFKIVDDEALLEEGAPLQNGTRKVVRSVLPHPRSQRSSSFRLEDNGSKLHYLRTAPHNDLSSANRGDLERISMDPSLDSISSESGSALFCYYQSVQVGYELGPSVTKCTIPGHDACMLLENTRSLVREMSCISASDCELTRIELLRNKVDSSVRLTCCRNNLCNSPTRPKQSSSSEKSSRQQQSKQQRTPALRDRHPFQPAIDEPLFPGLLNDPAFMGRSSQLTDVTSVSQMQQLFAPSARSARIGGRSSPQSSSILASSGLRHAASLLDRARPQKNRATTTSPYWNNIPGAAVQQGQPPESQGVAQDPDPAISSLISRVLNGGARGNSQHKLSAQSSQTSSRHNRPTLPFSPAMADLQPKQQSSQATEQDLYQQMMLLLGEVNNAKSGGSQSRTQQRAPENVLAANVCDFPPLMPNAWVSVASLEVGSEVYYQCSPGYQLDGPRVVTCTEQPAGTTASPIEGRLAEKILHAHPRWTQVPSCVHASDNSDKMASSLATENEVASHIMSRSSSSASNLAASIISEHFKQQLPDVASSQASSSADMGPTEDTSSALDISSDARRGNSASSGSDRVTQCYDNRAGSVFVASCRGDSVICTRIVTTGASAMSLLASETSGPSFNSESLASQALSDSLPSSSRSSSSSGGQQQQQQVSQYCALLDDCLRFERWVRLANRDDIDVLCCSTDLCNA